MDKFQGVSHTFFFNKDLSGSVLIQDALFNEDEGMIEINGADLKALFGVYLHNQMSTATITTLSADWNKTMNGIE